MSESVRVVRTVEELPRFTPTPTNGGEVMTLHGNNPETMMGIEGNATGLWHNAAKKADTMNAIGKDVAHENMQPSMAVYAWKRTA